MPLRRILNLTRSIAEITNLLFLFNADPQVFEKWKQASRAERLRKFSPAKIRDLLRDNGWPNPPVTEQAYRELCELATHVTPQTRPNRHNDDLDLLGFVGGGYDESGHKTAVNHLLLYASMACVVACKMFEMEARVHELVEIGKNTLYDNF